MVIVNLKSRRVWIYETRLVTDMSTDFIEAENLTKCYGGRTALNGLSLAVKGGEVTGLLGPNGAGKTTALSILATILRPHSGRASICGRDVVKETDAARSYLGLVTQSVAIYPALSGRENLEFFALMQGLSRPIARTLAQRMLEQVGLTDRAQDTAGSYSGGMKRRLNLACGIIHSPPVLLLDEPTVGVDPQSRELIFELIDKGAAEGRAVIYSTNYMEEAERLCHRVLLIDEGHIVANGSPQELVAMAGTPRTDPAQHPNEVTSGMGKRTCGSVRARSTAWRRRDRDREGGRSGDRTRSAEPRARRRGRGERFLAASA